MFHVKILQAWLLRAGKVGGNKLRPGEERLICRVSIRVTWQSLALEPRVHAFAMLRAFDVFLLQGSPCSQFCRVLFVAFTMFWFCRVLFYRFTMFSFFTVCFLGGTRRRSPFPCSGV
jgi:hypothetical protein